MWQSGITKCTASSFYLLLPPPLSSLPPSCSQCCIPAAVIHSGSYLLCILWSHSPHLTLSLSLTLFWVFFSPPSIFHIIAYILLCTFISSKLLCCSRFLSFSVLCLPHRRVTEVSIQPQQAANAKAQADEALLSSANQAVCVCVCMLLVGMSSSQAEGWRSVR